MANEDGRELRQSPNVLLAAGAQPLHGPLLAIKARNGQEQSLVDDEGERARQLLDSYKPPSATDN